MHAEIQLKTCKNTKSWLKNLKKTQKPTETTCWPTENLKIWRPTEIKKFHRGPTEITAGPVESLKFSREPTEITNGSTEKPENPKKPTETTSVLANWKIWNQLIWKTN